MTEEEFKAQLDAKVMLAAARIGSEVTRELKVVLSVPAPRRRTKSGNYVATVKATPGAPPRKLSGRGRAATSYYVERTPNGAVLYVGNNVIYMRVHEQGNHKWLKKTIERLMPTIIANFNKYIR